MKNVFAVSLLVLILSSFSWAKEGEKQVVPGKPCDASISLEEPALKEGLAFWGKVLEVKERGGFPAGQEIVFEPKNMRTGPKLKSVKVFMKRRLCRMDVKKNDYFSVLLDEKGQGTFYAIATMGGVKKSKKYPSFQSEFDPCVGLDIELGLTSADLFALATPIEIERDTKEDIEIVTFKTKRVWNGPDVSNFKLIQRSDPACSQKFSKEHQYDLVLNKANENYYYLAKCCGSVLKPGNDDYESRVSASRAELKKKYQVGKRGGVQ